MERAAEVPAQNVTLLACGDVGPMHKPLEPYSELVRPVLEHADIRFAQCERTYSTRGAQQLQHDGGHITRQPPEMAEVFAQCGFDVVSVASNHAMDWGPDAHLDTIARLNGMGIQTIGGGKHIAAARTPAIVDVRGVRVGFLGYSSVVRDGYAAGPDTPGVAPMRAYTYYASQEYQAGTPPRIITLPYEDDLQALCADIDATRPGVDVLIVSFHWGVHFVPRVIADYQRIVMREVFDHGADMILGHHPHIPKGIEVYNGKPCFYSLSNFIMTSDKGDRPRPHEEHGPPKYEIKLDPAFPRYPHQPYGIDGKRSLIVRAELTKEGVAKAGFLPVQIDMKLRPEALIRDDPRFDEAVEYMEWASEGLPHEFTVVGDEVVVS
jgi:poly-gamma-glutamate capsule biosynthesis protein CapA/YwtB (metallophosphatase superfamily)